MLLRDMLLSVRMAHCHSNFQWKNWVFCILSLKWLSTSTLFLLFRGHWEVMTEGSTLFCFQSSLFPISCNSIASVWLFYQISCSSNRNSKLEENWGLTVESPFVECKGDPWSFCGPCITLTGLLRRMRGYQDKAQESGHVNLTSHMDPCSSVISPLHRRVQNINGQQIGDAASA